MTVMILLFFQSSSISLNYRRFFYSRWLQLRSSRILPVVSPNIFEFPAITQKSAIRRCLATRNNEFNYSVRGFKILHSTCRKLKWLGRPYLALPSICCNFVGSGIRSFNVVLRVGFCTQ